MNPDPDATVLPGLDPDATVLPGPDPDATVLPGLAPNAGRQCFFSSVDALRTC